MAKSLTKGDAAQILKSVDTFFFDCDGVIWNTFGLIPGANELIDKLRAAGKQVFFVTNNNALKRCDLVKKCQKHGLNVDKDAVLSSACMTALYLKNLNLKKKVYLIGNPGLASELDEVGIKYIGLGPQPAHKDPTKSIFANYDLTKDPDVGAVVVAFDEHFSMNKIAQAMQYLRDESVAFIATNLDNAFPVGKDIFTPGTGCLVSAVATAAARKPIVVGKPHSLMFEIAKSMYSIDPERTLMTGDRLDSDILFGKNCGLKTLCVLSGVTSQKQLDVLIEEGDTRMVPDFVANDLRDLCSGFL